MAYTDEEKARALAMLKGERGNISRVSKALGITRDTLRAWRNETQTDDSSALATDSPPKKEPEPPALPELVEQASADLATRFEDEISAILSTLPSKRDGATYKDLATSIGILTDKIQLLRGQPTQRQEVLSVERKQPGPDALRELRKRLDRADLN